MQENKLIAVNAHQLSSDREPVIFSLKMSLPEKGVDNGGVKSRLVNYVNLKTIMHTQEVSKSISVDWLFTAFIQYSALFILNYHSAHASNIVAAAVFHTPNRISF